ncbi:UDP-N-acetylmuramate dehydrogenase, partial [Patescibacteria group bacterium]|nr:UDP-N-acetylmuramate dehydrogenase [Patescibacteria group bacterium]
MSEIEKLKEKFPNIELDKPLAQYSYFKVGGPAKYFLQPTSSDEFQSVVKYAIKQKIPYLILGAGANILISDQGFPGLVLKSGGKKMTVEGNYLIAEAAVPLGLLINEATKNSLTGLEFLAGIPGTVGGAIFGNAGGTDIAIGDKVEFVEIIDQQGDVRQLKKQECQFEYRNSILKKQGGIVLKAKLNLEPGDKQEIQKDVSERLAKKKSLQPLGQASAGCIFQNPPDNSAGRLIDEAGLK